MDFNFYLALGFATAFGAVFALSTRGILYATPDTDNEIMAHTAAQSYKWSWLSDMHKYGMKTSMKDMSIILIVLFQRIMRDNESDHPYTVLGGVSISISSVLIYLIGANYWGSNVGLFISLLYLFSFWPWQIALYGGHANIAGIFFLLAIYFVQNSTFNFSVIYLALAGISLCCMMFSSGSSGKLLMSFGVALFYAEHDFLIGKYDYGNLYLSLPLQKFIIWDFIVIGLVVGAISTALLFYKKIVKKMYNNEGPPFLRNIIKNQKALSLNHYLDHARNKLRTYAIGSVWLIAMVLLALNSLSINYVLPVFIGFSIMFFILTMPNVKYNIRKYLYYAMHTQRKTHFRSYLDYFVKIGVKVARNTRGGGWPWVPRFLWQFIPIHLILFLSSLLALLILRISQQQLYIIPFDLLVLIISTSPLWWAELTEAPQASKTYALIFAVLFLFIGYSFNVFLKYDGLLPVMISALILTLLWNLWILLSEVYPARMGATNLFKTLKNLNIKEIYTYKTNYNRSFVETIPGLGESEYTPRRKIDPPLVVHYINSITEVEDGWIVIPGTNGRAITMDSEPEAVNENFRYTKDPILNKLLESRDIEKAATAKFKTYGSSRRWSSECEVLSYMAIVLREITEEDLYRGYGWLVRSDNLRVLVKT
ncbi:MAG: hypothetical protein A3B86_02120 [Candidatus Yanofskybacteria bacterium RIFCSPHIGHO2_02_FULL_38_22b]|uniref:Glycosyltransferase RgtA/B/C/D-like domain-containing protein n=1 Tax=Candidatus Yanofskybacteria bacterium RIFCSPHIGHO2_02_FULL_38_22b TaxID=1802673 RepID=A0A1F8F1A5_9BACT|nr:MAG: hypothetical protein A2816_02995 [Candidatus Yanofskybacteria bacterium RIFCSPHIGHO2_01_FULL_39_44]OGN06917.1 MAG: hypothetical protein A3B86_02120 [Candidatus Yanofskybacteria bacterium RIFCSPHIGHO2_02_FULL_38_22b]OGN20679.1 MAG: hypothetical protein A2910_02695 [Candidatus Yanofskybacteria bacterium RIFCSPLOWO2_01_FULL_39_28]